MSNSVQSKKKKKDDHKQLKETRNSYFCVTPENEALHESASLFLK